MASKDIVGFLTLTDKDGNVVAQEPNVAFRYQAKYRTIYKWNTNLGGGTNPAIKALPWKSAYLLTDDDINVGHAGFYDAHGTVYPVDPTGSQVVMNTINWSAYRTSGTIGTVSTALVPRVFGGIAAVSTYTGAVITNWGKGDDIISQVDVPLDYTQIGLVYFHPAHQQANTVSTAVGVAYVTYTNSQFWDDYHAVAGVFPIVRIETGADAGYYFVQNNDWTNNRLFLRCLDGTPFAALATASGLLMTAAPGRRAWFNEVSVIPLSVGTLDTIASFFSVSSCRLPRSIAPLATLCNGLPSNSYRCASIHSSTRSVSSSTSMPFLRKTSSCGLCLAAASVSPVM